MSDVDFWSEIWKRKAHGREVFATATLLENKTFERWNQRRAGEPEFSSYTLNAGDTVIITCVSRFGLACIRGTDTDKETHGYDATIDPSLLKDCRFLSDGGKPWRLGILSKLNEKP